MSLVIPHLARPTVRVTFLALGLVLLAGCQSLSDVSSSAMVRVIDVSPDAPALDVYQGDTAVAYNLSFGTVTSYVPVTPGTQAFTVSPAGSRQVLTSTEKIFNPRTRYTVLVNNSTANLQQVILTDHEQSSANRASLKPSVRLIDEAQRIGPVDVYLVPAGQRITSVSPVVTNLAPGGNTGYLDVPACTCAAVMVPAGIVPSASTASHIETQANYGSGTVRTLILLDPPPTAESGLQVVTAIDTDSSE